MDIEKMIEQLRYLADTPSYTAFHDAKEREIICDQCEADFCYDKQQDAHWCMYEALSRAATALSTLQAENEKLRAELEQVKAERDAAVEAVKNMAEYIVCAGHVDYFLCDEISQEHHLKYQPKNDGYYDNEPCYKCIADWFLQGHKWQENC